MRLKTHKLPLTITQHHFYTQLHMYRGERGENTTNKFTFY